MAEEHGKTKGRIRDWKGLLHDETPMAKAQVFVVLLILATSMTFTQYGFIGVGLPGSYACYLFGLLVPLAAASLLLGKGAGSLFGLIAGGVLYIHARWQPLDVFERYFVTPLSSVVLYALAGFLLGLLFAVALRNNPQGKRRAIYLGIVCFVISLVVSLLFLVNGVFTMVVAFAQGVIASGSQGDLTSGGDLIFSSEWLGALDVMSGIDLQIVLDFVLMLATCLLSDYVARMRAITAGTLSVRTTFRSRLLLVTVLVFFVVQAVSFVAITLREVRQASSSIESELDYLCGKLEDELEDQRLVSDTLNPYVASSTDGQATGEVSAAPSIPAEVATALSSSHGITEVLEGYDFSDGTAVIFLDDKVVSSYSPAYPVGATAAELFDTWRTGTLEELASTGRLQGMLYSTKSKESVALTNSDEGSAAELGYMRASRSGDYIIMLAKPSSMVFEGRQSTVTWAAAMAFVLLATVFAVADRLLNRDVVSPIDRTNGSLARITSGDLDEVVNEDENREFASLSAGINETVGSLKDLIGEAERRNEQDLAVAKRIQESALPRTFPPFPEIHAFDIFAAMDPAKEVGGDFYDFFTIDDQTIGFLIADVSGKGIPGALFMMLAKSEIENYLSTGMEPAEAIVSANRRLCANNDAGMFVTVWAATLNWETGLLTYVNAGHNFPLLRRGRNGSWEWLKKKCGLFLGTFETAKYRQETLVLEPGDELVLYTDGVNEAFNPHEEEYGNDRLEAFLGAHADVHPRELVRALRSDVASWADGAEQSDDVTILALEYGAAPEVTGSITVPATLEHLSDATSFIAGELEQRLCPYSVQNKVEVALEELFVNVCRYAYEGADKAGNVTVSYAYGTNPSSITVELRDTGVPFDPVKLDDPTKPSSIQEAKIGGLGILMVKRTMDDFAYLRDAGANVVVFKKGW